MYMNCNEKCATKIHIKHLSVDYKRFASMHRAASFACCFLATWAGLHSTTFIRSPHPTLAQPTIPLLPNVDSRGQLGLIRRARRVALAHEVQLYSRAQPLRVSVIYAQYMFISLFSTKQTIRPSSY